MIGRDPMCPAFSSRDLFSGSTHTFGSRWYRLRLGRGEQLEAQSVYAFGEERVV